MDDGSTDGSAAICDQYAAQEERIRVVHKPNTGKPDTLNKAIGMAQGDYVGVIDSDDWLEPEMCEVLLQAMQQTGRDAAGCGYRNEFVGETVLDAVCRERQVLSSTEAIVLLCDRKLYGYLHGRLYRRQLLVEPVPPLRRYEDFAVLYQWLSHGNGLTRCPRNLYHYRQLQSSIMNSMDDRMFGFIELLEEVYHFIKENHVLPERQNKALAVKNCMRIAKDIARNTHGKKNTVRLYDIRETLNRLSPITYLKSNLKLRWRVWLLRHSIVGFKGAVRLDQLFVTNHQENDRTFYK
jgi:glycosyltransferase involved in cell wall biosynthesis